MHVWHHALKQRVRAAVGSRLQDLSVYSCFIFNSTLCMLGNFACFCRLLIFFFQNHLFLQNLVSRITSVSNNLYPDQDRLLVGPDLGPNCLQRLSSDDTNIKL